MTYLGTRPPTLDEWNKYELHHRARLAIKPGITGMWQVSGRSEITDFEEVVKSSKNRRSIQQLNAFGKAKMTFFNSEEISDAFGYMTPIMQIFAEARNNNAPIDSVYSQGNQNGYFGDDGSLLYVWEGSYIYLAPRE